MMAEYIEREALLDAIIKDCPDLVFYSKREAIECIVAEPAADVVPVVHGRWSGEEIFPNFPSLNGYCCSRCYQHQGRKTTYCPNCGAKMDGGNV